MSDEMEERRQTERRQVPYQYPPAPGGWTEGLPIWVRAIALVGVPAVIAVFLVWVGASDIPYIRREVEIIHAEVLQNRKLLEQQQIRADAQFRLLQRICSNTAKTDMERSRCFD